MMRCIGRAVTRRPLKAFDNANVKTALFFNSVDGMSRGVWGTTVLSGYLQDLPGDPSKKNMRVGLAEALQGLVQVIIALPAGYYADKYSREAVLRYGFYCGLLAIVVFYTALFVGKYDDEHPLNPLGDLSLEFILMCVGLSVAGAFDGLIGGPMDAIYHNSVSSDERAQMSTVQFLVRVICRASGPVMSSVCLIALGNDWTRQELRNTFFLGVGLSIFGTVSILNLREEHCIGAESEAITEYVALTDGDDEALEGIHSLNEEPPITEVDPNLEFAKHYVPRIVLLGDIVSGIASGMTVKFFPLFFKEESQMNPAAVSLIFAVSPLTIALGSISATRLTRKLGRVRVPMIFSTCGIILLVIMYYGGKVDDAALWRNIPLIVPIYIVRTALMNSCAPIRKSVLMDFVVKEDRAFWNSIDSVTRMSWSGSAFLGGYLCDHYGYGASFLITAIMQTFAMCLYATLLRFEKYIDRS